MYFQTRVEVKGNDDRYFVLTFVLCGCIAGILLAVVVIYLIRRNSRSKEKLQQITAAQEGNEAASKDYQVSGWFRCNSVFCHETVLKYKPYDY
jgi:receptor-type tyrosine-protein phosphatase N